MLDDKVTTRVEIDEKGEKGKLKVLKEITLRKQMDTEHSQNDLSGRIYSKLKVSSYFCDEFKYSYKTEKSLKKHKAKNDYTPNIVA